MPQRPPVHRPPGYKSPEQRRAEHDKTRPNSQARGYDGQWRKRRQKYLHDNPLCVHCQQGNRVTMATVVDHKIPHKGDKRLFWDESNWQALCKRCHDRKTVREDGGFGNK